MRRTVEKTNSVRMKRSEICLADLGYFGKVRPVLILSVEPGDEDRALVTYVVRTTSVRGTAYEILHHARGMNPGVFDAQGIGTTDAAISCASWVSLRNHSCGRWRKKRVPGLVCETPQAAMGKGGQPGESAGGSGRCAEC